MTRKLFGTDGIRGKANSEPITPDTVLKVAQAAALHFRRGDHRHRVVIGKDTRLSGYMLEPAMVAGFISMGMDVVLLGPLPTPAVAMLTRSLRADLGVMISASHNQYQDNGIKLFGADGYKLSDDVEAEIEARMQKPFGPDLSPSPDLGRAKRLEDESGRYIEFLKNTFPRGMRLDGMKIVVDCANGAAYKVAPRVFYELGAEVISLAVSPDGTNINKDCGATHPAALQEAVVRHGADIGIAVDGDADRLIVCDEKGQVVDGDQIMALIADDWHKSGRLTQGGVVATVMSNLGFERFLKTKNLELKRMPVGDRYVVDHMRANGYNLGGEQSGHVILGDHATTGDGLMSALQVLAIVRQRDEKVSAVCRVFDAVPQVLKSVRYQNKINLDQPRFMDAQLAAEKQLTGGRILVRKSGTEPVVRVMAEGDDIAVVKAVVQELCALVETLDREMGAQPKAVGA
jgi:phosphoglucosamine mutase